MPRGLVLGAGQAQPRVKEVAQLLQPSGGDVHSGVFLPLSGNGDTGLVVYRVI